MADAKYVLVPNPNYAGQKPHKIEATCHDKTPFITVRHACGYDMHFHESQLWNCDDMPIRTRCRECDEQIEFPANFFREAFERLRAEGWI